MVPLAKIFFKDVTSTFGYWVNASQGWRALMEKFYEKEMPQFVSNASSLMFRFNGQIDDNVGLLWLYYGKSAPWKKLARFCWR